MKMVIVIACERDTGIILDTMLAWFIQKDGQEPFRKEFASQADAEAHCVRIASQNPKAEFWIEEDGQRRKLELPTTGGTVRR